MKPTLSPSRVAFAIIAVALCSGARRRRALAQETEFIVAVLPFTSPDDGEAKDVQEAMIEVLDLLGPYTLIEQETVNDALDDAGWSRARRSRGEDPGDRQGAGSEDRGSRHAVAERRRAVDGHAGLRGGRHPGDAGAGSRLGERRQRPRRARRRVVQLAQPGRQARDLRPGLRALPGLRPGAHELQAGARLRPRPGPRLLTSWGPRTSRWTR